MEDMKDFLKKAGLDMNVDEFTEACKKQNKVLGVDTEELKQHHENLENIKNLERSGMNQVLDAEHNNFDTFEKSEGISKKIKESKEKTNISPDIDEPFGLN